MNSTMHVPASKQFSLGSIFLAMLMVAAIVGLAYRFALHGFAIGVDICVALWTLASFSNSQVLRPFSNRQLSITEIGTLVAISFILHGLAMPAVQSGPHRRRNVTPAVSAPSLGESTTAGITP